MATKVARELEETKHAQDLPDVQRRAARERRADAAVMEVAIEEANERKADRRRTAHEREVEIERAAQVEHQLQQDFIDHTRCP